VSREALVVAFSSFPSRLAAAATVAGPPPPGEWGATEITRHLIAVEFEVHQARLAELAVQENPRWSWMEPGQWAGEPHAALDALVDIFAKLRGATCATVRALSEAGWAREGTHGTFGKLDVAGLLLEASAHDEEHLAALRLAAQDHGAGGPM
jgi:hypothetical protein